MVFAVAAICGAAQDAKITIHANQVVHPVSRYLTGACIEDVNHEVYGGIDSQMIFGESFAEPAPPPALKGFAAYGGRWWLRGSELHVLGGEGPKLVSDCPAFTEGEASVDLLFPKKKSGNAGLIVKVSEPQSGADKFYGYEVSLDPSGSLVLGRHRQNWEPIRREPCEVPINQWLTLSVRMTAKSLEVLVNGKSVTQFEDADQPLETGMVGLRTWHLDACFRNLSLEVEGARRKLDFIAKEDWVDGVSGMWRALRRGSATGKFLTDDLNPFSGRQSQQITFVSGEGEIGIENQSLNRWGMHLIKGKVYEGYVWVRAAQPTDLFVALESRDGEKVYAEKKLSTTEATWQRLDFALKPRDSDNTGRFAIKLKRSGSIAVGYAFLQPGEWGRFKDLPVRKDVAEGLINQGITVLRQGGCMVNADEYRWKKMTGPRDRRPPYAGWWYPHSSNGWGIFDFLNFCEAAGFVAVPDVNIGETPADMADFIEYVNGAEDSGWGRKRAADGHPKPYRLKYLQIGNEERVNEDYWQKFKPIAEAIWAKDSEIILVVGDFAYGQPISDPFNFKGAAGGITNLVAQQNILRLAKQHNREVWFDVHIGTDGPLPDFGGTFTFIDAIDRIAEGAKHRVVIFEFNAGNHSHRRALANALAIQAIERDGRIPIASSANCLQPDGQNDNDWNQGLLFLNPSRVWLQPPGYVTQMFSRNYLRELVRCDVSAAESNLDVNAKRSNDGNTIVLQVVNPGDKPVDAQVGFAGFTPRKTRAQVTELSGALDQANTAGEPRAIAPVYSSWKHMAREGLARRAFNPRSITVIRFQ